MLTRPGGRDGPDRCDEAIPELPGKHGPGQARPDGPGSRERCASDADIIEISLHEPSYFGVLFDRHAKEILRYAHARLGPDLAEDMLAETFLAAFGRRKHYDYSRADARPWLYGIAIRQIGRHRRAEHRHRRALARLPAEAVTGDISDRSADRATAQQLRPRLLAVLSALPHRDRELLLLIAWAGLTCEEAAQALGMPASTTRSRLHRIRIRTRRALGGTNPAGLAEESRDG